MSTPANNSVPFRKSVPSKSSPEVKFSTHLASERCPDLDWPLYASPSEGSGLLYRWSDAHWNLVPQQEAERLAWQWLQMNCPEEATPRRAQSCVSAACLEVLSLPDTPREIIVIPTKTGYLHVDPEGKGISLRSPDPRMGVTYCLSCGYEQDARSPEFYRFIEEVLPDPEVRDLVQEYVGYSLLGDTRYQKAQWWIGSGANGKGTLAHIVSALHHRASSLSLDNLDGFRLVPLLDATLVYVDETPKRIDEQRLKTLLSGDLISIDRKYRDPISFRPTAKWIVLGNDLPVITDQSDGFWRRWHIIPFPVSFPEEKQRPLLARQIIQNELSGVLNWALTGLMRLLERGHFLNPPQAVKDAIQKGKKETNSVLAWWEDAAPAVTAEPDTPKDEIYSAYREWTLKNGMSAVSSNKFWSRARQIEPKIEEDRIQSSGNRKRVVNLSLSGYESLTDSSSGSERNIGHNSPSGHYELD